MANLGLQGKVAIITGGGQGLGRAFSKRLADEGCRVVIAERNPTTGRSVEAEIRKDRAEALFVETDVSDEASCLRMKDAVISAFGQIDVLVNNAGILSTLVRKPFWEVSLSEWDDLMGVNLRGMFIATGAVTEQMRAQREGSVINMSSGTFHQGRVGYVHYVSSKAGVIGLTRSMARELGDYNIRVNAITPGPVFTEVPRETVDPAERLALVNLQCLKRPAEPADIAGVVAFLAGEDSRWVTGQTLNVDGGLMHP